MGAVAKGETMARKTSRPERALYEALGGQETLRGLAKKQPHVHTKHATTRHRFTPYSRRWEQAANELARSYCPDIYACQHCSSPVITGYCCTYCGSAEPEYFAHEAEQERYGLGYMQGRGAS